MTGESGSGKTVAFDTILQYLEIDQPSNEKLALIRHAVTVMSAMGHSLSADGDDSSRYGRMLELQLDKNQKVIGAGLTCYGLEVSRVTEPHPDQRNFHVFHYITEGTTGPGRDALHLSDAHSYRLLYQNGPMNIPGVD